MTRGKEGVIEGKGRLLETESEVKKCGALSHVILLVDVLRSPRRSLSGTPSSFANCSASCLTSLLFLI